MGMWACSLPKIWLLTRRQMYSLTLLEARSLKSGLRLRCQQGCTLSKGSRAPGEISSLPLSFWGLPTSLSWCSQSSRTHCLFFSTCQIYLCLYLTRMVVTEFMAHSNNLGLKFLKLSHIYGGFLPYKLNSQVPGIRDCYFGDSYSIYYYIVNGLIIVHLYHGILTQQ